MIETVERGQRPYRTREEAARLLEGLRMAYQGLSSEGRGQIKRFVERLAQMQSTIEQNEESNASNQY